MASDIPDWLVDLGAALVAASLFFWWQRKRLLRASKFAYKRRTALVRCLIALAPILLLYGQDLHTVSFRVLVMSFVFGYAWLWRKRYQKAKGKLRAIAFIPKGENYDYWARLANSPGRDAKYLSQDSTNRWPYLTPNDLEAKNS